jgi:hypothetical protein
VDFTINARMANGLTFQGGTNTGRGVRDTCEVLAKLPEIQALPPFGAPTNLIDSCAVTEKWLTTARGLVTYVVPKVDVLVSAVLRSNPNTFPANDPASTGGVAGCELQRTQCRHHRGDRSPIARERTVQGG